MNPLLQVYSQTMTYLLMHVVTCAASSGYQGRAGEGIQCQWRGEYEVRLYVIKSDLYI